MTRHLQHLPAVALIGPRHCGKSSLAQHLLRGHGERTRVVPLDTLMHTELPAALAGPPVARKRRAQSDKNPRRALRGIDPTRHRKMPVF